MRIHERLLLLLRDPGLPRWCGWLIGVGFLIPGPLDELVIFPLVFFVVWVWRGLVGSIFSRGDDDE